VDVVIGAGGLRLKISDNGSGTGTGGGLDTGRGLNNMRSRARELGGELTLSRDAGTQLMLHLPIPDNSPASGARG
jgi:signal transduction histidine kinase